MLEKYISKVDNFLYSAKEEEKQKYRNYEEKVKEEMKDFNEVNYRTLYYFIRGMKKSK